MKIKYGRNTQGTSLVLAVVLGALIVTIGVLAVVILIKVSQLIPPPPKTDTNKLIDVPYTRAWNAWVAPDNAVAIQASTNLADWSVRFYMTIATNPDQTIHITTYDADGNVVGWRNFDPGPIVTNEVTDFVSWPHLFYRVKP